MPQLDALTYFSQYVYLLITFIAVYYFVLSFIIPKILCTFKIRQKLNSLNQKETITGEEKQGVEKPFIQTDSLKLLTVFSKYYSSTTKPMSFMVSNNMPSQYGYLAYNSWLTETCQSNVVESANQWLVSTAALQLVYNLRLKKILCDHIVRKINVK